MNTIRTRIGPEARTVELPLLVRPGSFLFLLSQAGAEGVSFRCGLGPLSRRGNFGRLCLGSIYSSSYGMQYNSGTGKNTTPANIQFAANWSDLSKPGLRANQSGPESLRKET